MSVPAWSEKSSKAFHEYTGVLKSLQRRLRFNLRLIAIVLLSLVVLSSFLVWQTGTSSATISYFQPKPQWHGWEGVEYLFTFGDSWTSNNFAHDGRQPSHQNPIGNPDWPGDASCNGPNWVAWLTGTYNQSFIRSYDLAHGAATIDRDIIPPLFTQSYTFREQISKIFVPYYAHSPTYAPWTPSNMLVAVWSGIVDVELFVRNQNLTTIIPSLVDSYFTGLEDIYKAGGRNFLLLKLPSMYRSPECEDRILSQAFLKKFHDSMDTKRANFTTVYPDATVMVFDTHKAFNKFLDEPRRFEALERVANFSNWCQDYNDMLGVIVDSIDAYKPECGVSIDRYFWINAIHPGFAVHNATSAAIVDQCMGPSRKEWCL